jgi:hypothetical protein
VGAVGVHLDHDVVALAECPREARQIRGAEALLAQSVHHVDVVVRRRQLVRQCARPVGRVVVGHQHVRLGHRGPQAAHDDREGRQLVKRGDDDHDPTEIAEVR